MFHRPAAPTANLAWLNTSDVGFASLGATFATPTEPTPLPAAHWVGCNEALRAELGLPSDLWQQQEALICSRAMRCPRLAPLTPVLTVVINLGNGQASWAMAGL